MLCVLDRARSNPSFPPPPFDPSAFPAHPGAFVLVDLSDRLPGLRRRAGVSDWKVMTAAGDLYPSWCAPSPPPPFYYRFCDAEKISPTVFGPTGPVARGDTFVFTLWVSPFRSGHGSWSHPLRFGSLPSIAFGVSCGHHIAQNGRTGLPFRDSQSFWGKREPLFETMLFWL